MLPFQYSTILPISQLQILRSAICNDITNHTSKTLTLANQTEIPILNNVTVSLNTSIKLNSRQFIIPFAVAGMKNNSLGTPYFEECIQNFTIQDFTAQFEYQSKDQINVTKLTPIL